MFINRGKNGEKNLCGKIISKKRLEMNISQRKLADLLQLQGLDLDKNAIQKIEAGNRFVTDIELVILMKYLNFNIDDLQ